MLLAKYFLKNNILHIDYCLLLFTFVSHILITVGVSRTSLKRSRVVRIKIISYESFIGNEKLRNEPIGKYIFTSSRILKDNYYV